MTQRPISEYLSPETKTVIEYDCMPTFANILAASIIDMDKNRIVESFGIKKGIELEFFFLVNMVDLIKNSKFSEKNPMV